MAQSDTLDWLQAHPGWHKPQEVAQGLGKNVAKTRRLLLRLWHYHEIERREIDQQRSEYRYPDSEGICLRRAPGTCCPEPSCDYTKFPVFCDGCGAKCNECKLRSGHVSDGSVSTEETDKAGARITDRVSREPPRPRAAANRIRYDKLQIALQLPVDRPFAVADLPTCLRLELRNGSALRYLEARGYIERVGRCGRLNRFMRWVATERLKELQKKHRMW